MHVSKRVRELGESGNKQKKPRNTDIAREDARRRWNATLGKFDVTRNGQMQQDILHLRLSELVAAGRHDEAYELAVAAACRLRMSAMCNNAAREMVRCKGDASQKELWVLRKPGRPKKAQVEAEMDAEMAESFRVSCW